MANLTRDDVEDHLFLRIAHNVFQDKMLEYYRAGKTVKERTRRAKQIINKLKGIQFKDGAKTFSLAPPKAAKGKAVKCEGGYCICRGCCMPCDQCFDKKK